MFLKELVWPRINIVHLGFSEEIYGANYKTTATDYINCPISTIKIYDKIFPTESF